MGNIRVGIHNFHRPGAFFFPGRNFQNEKTGIRKNAVIPDRLPVFHQIIGSFTNRYFYHQFIPFSGKRGKKGKGRLSGFN